MAPVPKGKAPLLVLNKGNAKVQSPLLMRDKTCEEMLDREVDFLLDKKLNNATTKTQTTRSI